MTATTHTVSFVIHGDFLVERARDRVIEGAWEHGLEILVDGLHGMTYEIALAILKGEKTLTGNSRDDNVELADQDQTDETFLRYKETFDYQFAGVMRLENGRIVRPYAVVDSFGEDDFRSNLKHESLAQGSDFVKSRPVRYRDALGHDPIDWSYRALFYADRPHDDIVKKVQLPGYHGTHLFQSVLFEVVHDYPKLLAPKVTTSAQEAVDLALKARRTLERRGYVYNRGEVDSSSEFKPVTTVTIDGLPNEWVVENPNYVPPTPRPSVSLGLAAANKVSSVKQIEAAMGDDPFLGQTKAMNQLIVENTKNGMSISTAVNLARAKMTLMGGMAEDPEKRLEAINAHLASRAEEAEGKSIETYRKAILEQAAGDVFDLVYTGKDGAEVTLKVPTAPFEQWTLWRTSASHLAKPWKRVTYSGMKMFGDDPYHTDWVIGAGLHPDDWPSDGRDPLHKAAWDHRYKVSEEKMGGNMAILLGTGYVTGKIKMLKPGETLAPGQIGVIRNAGPDYVQAAQSAIDNNTALICENGGVVAHLVTVYRDKPLRLARIANARKLFKDGIEVSLDFDKAKRTIHEGSRGPAPGDLYMPPQWEINDDV